MEAMAVLEKQQQFDFQNNGIEVMNFETLQLPTRRMISTASLSRASITTRSCSV